MHGARAVEHLQLISAELKMATVHTQVGLSLFTDFDNFTKFKLHARHEKTLQTLLGELILWGEALKGIREHALQKAA